MGATWMRIVHTCGLRKVKENGELMRTYVLNGLGGVRVMVPLHIIIIVLRLVLIPRFPPFISLETRRFVFPVLVFFIYLRRRVLVIINPQSGGESFRRFRINKSLVT